MNLFVEIHERNKDLDMQLSIATIETYKEKDIVDPDGTTHLCILYIINNGLRFEEEFNSSSDREAKMNLLEEYIDSGGGGNLEDKSVTITQNGSTTITADEGYDGLNSVNVTTNVDTQGRNAVIEGNTQHNLSNRIADLITSIDYFDTSNMTNLSGLFQGCKKITTIPLLNTSNATSMESLFNDCSLITTIPQLDTSNATNMSYMFFYCDNLQAIPQLNTSKVTNMSSMFTGCSKLLEIPLLNTSIVTKMDSLFNACSKLLEIPQLNTINVTDMSYMFGSCTLLTTIPILNTSKVTNMSNMFMYCNNLNDTSLDNILQMCINVNPSYSRAKTLKELGFTANKYPTSRIQALPHYQDFIDAGWTIGY